MKTNMKRFLSVLLAAVMLCGMLAIVPVARAASTTLTVIAKSNLFGTSTTNVDIDGDTYVFVDFKMNAPGKLLVNADIRYLTYDPAVLEWKEEYNQIVTDRNKKTSFFAAADELGVTTVVRQKEEEGKILGNFSSVTTPIYAYGENNEPITVVTAVFKVKDPTAALNGTTQVNCNVKYLALCDSEYSGSPYIQYQAVNDGIVNSEISAFVDTSSTVESERQLFNGQTLSVEGDIAVNFYLNLTAEEIEQGVRVDFSWFDKFGYVVLSSDDFISSNKGYKAVCHVAPAEMAYPITVKVSVNGEEKRQTLQYSVCDYANYILSDTYQDDTGMDDEQYGLLVDLVLTMLDYGTRAQEAFKRTDAGLANGGKDYLDYNYNAVLASGKLEPQQQHINQDKLADYGLEYYNSTIIYLTKVTIRHYYQVIDREKFDAIKDSITFGGKIVEKIGTTGNFVYFDYAGVDAVDSPVPYVLQIGDYSYSYAVYDYIYLCLNADMNKTTKRLVTAAFYFSESAAAYFDYLNS